MSLNWNWRENANCSFETEQKTNVPIQVTSILHKIAYFFFFHKINFSAIYKLPLNPFILYDLQNAFYLKVFKLDSLYGFVKEHHLSTSQALLTEKYN